ncbi:hypothetical protein [Arsukibacterium indicum]|uniref:Uncharacterized protein n=1 Tax=Arsukibacterium indicum TaxID=2848612 RepID=A0ABS6MNL1_9GAMM|nr:hypothetical protein [Arsukibacterium indicum]MBV2130404.1 hypothetical protein [Arsukibacterium indicum]
MSFLETKYALNGTPFKSEDLDYARLFWKVLIEHADRNWLVKPKGQLAKHWQSTSISSAVQLIDLGSMLYALSESMTSDSEYAFENKVRALLNSDGVQFEEQLTELLVGALLRKLKRQLQLDCPSFYSILEGQKPKNVDYGLHWSNDSKRVFIEVTVFHIQKLVDWEAAISHMMYQFQQAVIKSKLNRALSVTAPLVLNRRTLPPKVLRKAIQAIANSERGKHEIALGEEVLTLEWTPAVHYKEFPGANEIDPTSFGFTFGNNIEILTYAGMSMKLAWPGNAEELVNRSLRNTLDLKLKQFNIGVPYVLMIRILNERVSQKRVIDLLLLRVFSNNKYSRISAVGLLMLRFSQDTGYQTHVNFVSNPNAINKLPDDFLSTFTDSQT